MYRFKVLLFFLLGATIVNAQFLHTPTEIQKIIKKSPISYSFDTISAIATDVPPPIISKNSDFSILQQEIPVNLSDHRLKRKVRNRLTKANKFFDEAKYDQALKFYQELLATTQAIELLPRLAYCFEKMSNTENALAIYNKIHDSIPTDPALNFTIARLEHQSGNSEAAIRHINWAHLYDRNHPVYLDSLIIYYYKNGWHYRKMDFAPVFLFQEISDSTIVILTEASPWHAYATCKAIWKYEPGYQKQMSYLSTVDVNIIEEKECLLNAVISFEKLPEGKEQYPMLGTLSKVIPEKRIDDFLLYEISLRKQPALMQQIPHERMEQVLDYIVTYRMQREVK